MPGSYDRATGRSLNSRDTVGQSADAWPAEMYVNEVGNDGWLQALDSASKRRTSLFKYTKLTNISSQDGRTSFVVQEGPAKGRTLSLWTENAKRYLGRRSPERSAITVTVEYGKYREKWHSSARDEDLNQQMATMTVGTLTVQVTMNSVWGAGFSPLPAGKYSLLLPDAPHSGAYTRFYRQAAPALVCDQVWFPIQFEKNSRYVHVGNVSEGCVTVLDLAKWSEVHEALISHRMLDRSGTVVGVGTLVVKGTPERAK